jgi:hypothetical protein
MALRMVKAVVDRVEENGEGRAIAVILIEDEGLQLDILMEELPEPVSAGDWLRLELDDANRIKTMDILDEETERRRRWLQERWDRLRSRRNR